MSVKLFSAMQYLSTFCAKASSYWPALNRQATAAAEMAGRAPPPDLLLYWMPPYCVDDDALQLLAATTRAAIDHAIEEAACA